MDQKVIDNVNICCKTLPCSINCQNVSQTVQLEMDVKYKLTLMTTDINVVLQVSIMLSTACCCNAACIYLVTNEGRLTAGGSTLHWLSAHTRSVISLPTSNNIVTV